MYVTTTLEKALNYAKGTQENPKPHRGCILELKVDLGRMYTLNHPDDPLKTKWQAHNYDSCFSAAGLIGVREEHCVAEASRVKVVDFSFGQE